MVNKYLDWYLAYHTQEILAIITLLLKKKFWFLDIPPHWDVNQFLFYSPTQPIAQHCPRHTVSGGEYGMKDI